MIIMIIKVQRHQILYYKIKLAVFQSHIYKKKPLIINLIYLLSKEYLQLQTIKIHAIILIISDRKMKNMVVF